MRRRAGKLIAAAVVSLVAGLALCGHAVAQTVAPPTPTTTPPPGIGLGPAAPAAGAPTTPAPAAGPSAGGSDDNPGFFDIGGRVRKAINDWFRDLVTSAVEPVLNLLGQTVLSTPDVGGTGRVQDLWRVSAGMSNGFYVLFVVVGGAIVMGHETLQTRYSAKEIAPRLVVGAIAANVSLALAGLAIGVANALSRAFLGQGIEPAGATTAMRTLVLGAVSGGGIFLVLVGLVVAVLGVVLLAVYIVRVAMVVVLVAGAPVALSCHALPQTEGLAQLWWRAFAACLGVQVAQSLVLVTALRVFFDSDGRSTLGLSAGGSLVDLLVVVCLLWVLLRIPTWAGRMVFSGRRGSTGRMVRNVVVYKAIRAVAAGA